MATNTARVSMLRHVQGERTEENGEKEILTKGSVVDVSEVFAAELVHSKAADYAADDAKPVRKPLHPEAEQAAKK